MSIHALHAVEVGLAAGLDQRVEADRSRCQRPDVAQPRPELVAVHIGERDRLDHAESTGLADGRDQFRVRAGIHRAADQRHGNAGMACERCFHQRLGPRRQRTVARATTSPCRSTHSAVHVDLHVAADSRHGDAAHGPDRAARLLQVLHRDLRDDAADANRQSDQHGEAARLLGNVEQRDGVHGTQVIAVRATIGNLHLGVARLEHADARTHRTRSTGPESRRCAANSHCPPGSGRSRRHSRRRSLPVDCVRVAPRETQPSREDVPGFRARAWSRTPVAKSDSSQCPASSFR